MPAVRLDIDLDGIRWRNWLWDFLSDRTPELCPSQFQLAQRFSSISTEIPTVSTFLKRLVQRDFFPKFGLSVEEGDKGSRDAQQSNEFEFGTVIAHGAGLDGLGPLDERDDVQLSGGLFKSIDLPDVWANSGVDSSGIRRLDDHRRDAPCCRASTRRRGPLSMAHLENAEADRGEYTDGLNPSRRYGPPVGGSAEHLYVQGHGVHAATIQRGRLLRSASHNFARQERHQAV
jgi:hypothetical protein